eukprot:1427893-Rhodomonas_salina.1
MEVKTTELSHALIVICSGWWQVFPVSFVFHNFIAFSLLTPLRPPAPPLISSLSAYILRLHSPLSSSLSFPSGFRQGHVHVGRSHRLWHLGAAARLRH